MEAYHQPAHNYETHVVKQTGIFTSKIKSAKNFWDSLVLWIHLATIEKF